MANESSVASGNRRGSLWERLSSSFWFVPAILTAAGFLLSLVTQPLDRVLQVVLGAYIGTFVYSLMVLRLISTSGGGSSGFNPVVSVAVAIILALVCVSLLIYFINHVAQIIQSSTIVRMAHGDTMPLVSSLDDHEESSETIRDPEEHPDWAELLAETPAIVRAHNSGYVNGMNFEEILDAVAEEETKVVEIPFGPGDFVSAGLPIVKVWPDRDEKPDSEAGKRANKAFVFGKERSFQQDLAFGLRQLSDIALKGLSPGINDPTTAMQAMDRMEAIFIALGDKALPRRVQRREVNETEVLVKVGYSSFDELVGLAFDQVRRAAFTSGQVAVLELLLKILDRALQTNSSDERQQALWDRVFAVARQAPKEISDPYDAAKLVLRAVRVVRNMTMNQRVRSDKDLDHLAELSDDLPDDGKIRETINLLRQRVG